MHAEPTAPSCAEAAGTTATRAARAEDRDLAVDVVTDRRTVVEIGTGRVGDVPVEVATTRAARGTCHRSPSSRPRPPRRRPRPSAAWGTSRRCRSRSRPGRWTPRPARDRRVGARRGDLDRASGGLRSRAAAIWERPEFAVHTKSTSGRSASRPGERGRRHATALGRNAEPAAAGTVDARREQLARSCRRQHRSTVSAAKTPTNSAANSACAAANVGPVIVGMSSSRERTPLGRNMDDYRCR